ncbi:RNA polymerase factor sigma-54 [Paractinoplanes deccanensis]|nr:hypothetical protein [Actinoplanes deccanensis]
MPGLTQVAEVRLGAELRTLPAVLHSLGMLPLAQPALAREVDRALAGNPVLCRRSGGPCPGCGCHRPPGAPCVRCTASARPVAEPAVRPFETLEALAGWEIRSDCRAALPVVVGHLTARGLLDDEPESIAAASGLPVAAIEEAIRAVRAAGPPGIAERSVAAMLAAQAQSLVDGAEAPAWLPALVRDHLAAVADGDHAGIARALGVSPAAARAAIALIRARLRPFALAGGGAEAAGPPPDAYVSRGAGGQWRVEVPDSAWFGLRVASVPPAVRADPEAAAWLSRYERSARDLLQQLDVRAGVLRRVTACAVRHQAGYFDRGPAGHVPLTRTEVADELGLHPSTVSRCVAGKTVRGPDGRLLPLAALFGGAVAAKTRVAALLAADPLSDAQVSRALAAEGFTVARRTVAKYRAELGIAART